MPEIEVLDEPPPAGPFESLELLWDQVQRTGEWVTQVDESVSIEGSTLHRTISIRVQIPQRTPDDVGDMLSVFNAPFAYALRMPRKGVIWPIDDLIVDGERNAELMAHPEHEAYSIILLAVRFWSIMDPWAQADGINYKRRRRFALNLFNRHLKGVVYLPPPLAAKCLARVFRSDGSLRFLRAGDLSSSKVARLHRLSADLADRYFKMVAVFAYPGETMTLNYSFEDTLPDVDNEFGLVSRDGWVDRLRDSASGPSRNWSGGSGRRGLVGLW